MRASGTPGPGAGWQMMRARCFPFLMVFLVLLPVRNGVGRSGGGAVVSAEASGNQRRPAFGFQGLSPGDVSLLAGSSPKHSFLRPPTPSPTRKVPGGGVWELAAKAIDDMHGSRLLRSGPARWHGAREGRSSGPVFKRGPRVALRDLLLFFTKLFAHATQRLGHAVASLAVMMALSAPLSASAASICIPLPTPSGIARVCVDVGEPSAEPREGMPEHVNAHRTPSMSEGNILSRAGVRPLAMFSDAQAKIKAVAAQRLQLIEHLESGAPKEPELTGPARRRELMEKGIDGVAIRYGDRNAPRSTIIADKIDPIIVTAHLVLAGKCREGVAAGLPLFVIARGLLCGFGGLDERQTT